MRFCRSWTRENVVWLLQVKREPRRASSGVAGDRYRPQHDRSRTSGLARRRHAVEQARASGGRWREVSHDTELGAARYPTATRLLITTDCGGSNGVPLYLWKRELQVQVGPRKTSEVSL